MPFSEMVGHEQAVAVLRRAVSEERLPNGYLFVGPAHVGKTALAIALAQEANCERSPRGADLPPARLAEGETPPAGWKPAPRGGETGACGECPTCRRIAAGLHPDVKLVQPRLSVSATKKVEGSDQEEQEEAETLAAEMEGAAISVKEIEGLLASLSLTAVEARHRFYIVASPETMEDAVSNRLLKSLEEPPPDTTIILTTSRPARVLTTLISRCRQVTLHALSPEEMARQLAERYPEATAEQRAVVAGLSAGAWGRAKGLMEDPRVLDLRKEVLEMAASLTRREPWEAIRLAENLAATTERWWQVEHPEDVGARMLKAGRDRVLRTQLRALLEVLESWFRDLLAVGSAGWEAGATRTPRLVNPDYREELLYAARRYPPQAAVEACRVLGEFRRDLGQNANLRLGLEVLWVRLMALRTE